MNVDEVYFFFLHFFPAVFAPNVTPTMATFIFGEDEEATFRCSSTGNPLPLLQWSISGSPIDGNQPATGTEEAISNVNINITKLGVGAHTIECTASVTVGTTYESQSTTVAITVQAVLQNISVLPEMQTITLESGTNDTVTLNCTVEANPGPPRIEWSSNSQNITSQAGPVTQIGETLLYLSELTLPIGELARGENVIICTAFQDAETPPTMVNDMAIVNIFGKIQDLNTKKVHVTIMLWAA